MALDIQKIIKDTKYATKVAKIMVRALAFYADPKTYFGIALHCDRPTGGFDKDLSKTQLGMKPGKRARKALEAAAKIE